MRILGTGSGVLTTGVGGGSSPPTIQGDMRLLGTFSSSLDAGELPVDPTDRPDDFNLRPADLFFEDFALETFLDNDVSYAELSDVSFCEGLATVGTLEEELLEA